MLNVITICVCFLSNFALAQNQNESGQLISVVMIFRHGDRVIINPYPKDPYKNSSFWPAGWGQLTNLGKLQHYELGTWFRNRYQDLLPAEYSEKDIFVISTDVDRTLMSAEADLAGLYPPKGGQIWDKSIPWQPIPIHTRPELEDYLLAMKKPCPRYDLLKHQLLESPEFKEIALENKDLIDYVAESTGASINFETLEFIYNTLTIEKNNNLTLPDWTRGVYPDKMKPLAELSFAIPCYTSKMAILKTGPLFQNILNNIFNVTEGIKFNQHTRKIWMYSGHDVTIGNILQSLRIFEYHSPPYTSTVLFELRQKGKGDYFVNIFYKNSSEPRKMTLPGCSIDCPLEKFATILESISLTPKQWEHECKLTLLAMVETANKQQLLIVAGILLVSLIIFAIMIKVIYSKYNKPDAVYLRLPDDDEHV